MVATSERVSIVLPIYNQAALLEATFRSLFAQTWEDLEIIAVDDGSQDGSLDVLRSLHDERLIVVAKSNGGQSSAVNAGLRKASGAFVKIMDGDDLLGPTHIEAQVRALAGRTDAVASSRWTYFVSHPEGAPVPGEITDRHYDDPVEWILDTLRDSRGMFAVWQWLIPRGLVDRLRGWDERLSLEADFEFTTRLLLAAREVRFATGAVLYYRKGIASQSSWRSRRALESAILATELVTDELVRERDVPEVRRALADRFQEWTFLAYPCHPDLVSRTERKVQELGGSSIPLPAGRIGRSLAPVLHWKAIRRLQDLSRRLGWSRVLRLKERQRLRRLAHRNLPQDGDVRWT